MLGEDLKINVSFGVWCGGVTAHKRTKIRGLTTLQKFEALGNVALVAHKEEAALRQRFFLLLLVRGNFGTESDALTHNAMGFGTPEVGARIGLADVCREWAAFLAIRIKAKVVVSRDICPELWVILERSDIDGCAYPGYQNNNLSISHCETKFIIYNDNWDNIPLFHRPTRRAPSKSAPSF